MTGDPHWSSVQLLCPFDGASTWLDDLSQNGFTVTAVSSFNFRSGYGRFADCGGRTGTSTLSRGTIAHNAAFIPGAGPFTIECWHWRSATSLTRGIFSKYLASGDERSWSLFWASGSGLRANLSLDGASFTALDADSTTTTGQWLHICLERNASNLVRLYIDGVVVDSVTLAGALYNNTGALLELGGYNGANAQLGDRIDEARITLGVARYDGAFSPPSAPFPIGPEAGETVEPSAGSLIITGFVPGLIVDEIISALPGSLVLTGGVPEVILDELIAPFPGSLIIQGDVPGVRSGITLLPEPGQLIITGQQPIVTTFQFVAASQQAAVALAEADREARASLIGAVALAEIIPQSNASQMGFVALAEVIPPVAASQQAVVLVASGEPCVTRRAQFWKITRTDGEVFAFTSHDRAIEIDGLVYQPCDSLTPSASSSQAEVGGVGDMELAGIIASDAISAEDLQAGLFDDAYVEAVYQSWEDAADIVRVIMAGWLGGVSHGEDGFRAEVIGPGGRLSQRPLTQMYTPACRWRFGDERCGVDIDALGLSGTVVSSITRGDFTAAITGVPGSAQYSSGRVRWLTGANAGAITEVKAYNDATGRIILWAPAPFRPSAGDTFDLLPGCDQLRETCRDVYANVVNFGGFPDVPGEDAVVETPQAKY